MAKSVNAIRVASSELYKKLGQYLDFAQGQPVVIQRDGIDAGVLLSMGEWYRLKDADNG